VVFAYVVVARCGCATRPVACQHRDLARSARPCKQLSSNAEQRQGQRRDVIMGTTGAPNLRTKSLPNCILKQFAHRSTYIVTENCRLGAGQTHGFSLIVAARFLRETQTKTRDIHTRSLLYSFCMHRWCSASGIAAPSATTCRRPTRRCRFSTYCLNTGGAL
jgi:hypothetical protein